MEDGDDYVVPQKELDKLWKSRTLLFNLTSPERRVAEAEFRDAVEGAASRRVVGRAEDLPTEERLAAAPHNTISLLAAAHAPLPWPFPAEDDLLTTKQGEILARDPMWPKFMDLVADFNNFAAPPTVGGILTHAQHQFNLPLTPHISASIRGPNGEGGIVVSFQIGNPGRYYVALVFRAENNKAPESDILFLDKVTTRTTKVHVKPLWMFRFTCTCRARDAPRERCE